MAIRFARKRQNVLLYFVVAAAAFYFAATGARAAEPVIGILPKTIIGDVFMKNMSDAAVAKGKELGAKVEVYGVSSHEAVEEQVSAMEALISRKVDAIILAAVDSKGLAPVVDKATAAGIPVILADSGVQGANYVTVVQTDNIAATNLAADYAAALLSHRGKVAQLEGEPASETAQLRKKGFHEQIAKYKNIELVASITGHWTTPGAVDATEAILKANPDVNLIFASSDLMAVGASTVLEREGRKDIMVLGFDGIPEGVALVKQLKAVGDVAQNAKGMGEKAAQIAVQVIKDKNAAASIPKVIDSGFTLVHPWNVDTYSKENFGQ
ncbi:MAG: sugar ABC transporter substrate-binding protein [Ktedonobacteraceae bacterium]|nr:sugar ABC transporter substrate-binding protein [Ktedonobacteraceae bacterium]